MKPKTSLLLAGAAALTLTACTDTSVHTSDPNQRAKEGAIVGGLIGAATGILMGDNADERARGAVIGGALGAGAGAAIGASLDRQAAELRRTMDGRVTIVNEGDRLVVSMPNGILFAVDSARITGVLADDLRILADSLQRYPGTTVRVAGHTDNTGTASYNQDLSDRRADSVAAVLIANGVVPSRIVAYGRGESEPVASNLTEEGRAENRRVEVFIIPDI